MWINFLNQFSVYFNILLLPDTIYLLNCVVHLKQLKMFWQLSSTFAHSYVAIEFLFCSKTQNPIFIDQERSQCLGFKRYFCTYIYQYKIQWLESEKRQRTHFILRKKQKKYKNKTIYVTILNIRKQNTLWHAIFHDIFEVIIYIQKEWHFVSRDISIYKTPGT